MQEKQDSTKNRDTIFFKPFEILKTVFKVKDSPKPTHQGKEETKDTKDDNDLFEKAMKEVREIKEFREIPVDSKKITPLRRIGNARESIVEKLREISSGKTAINITDTQEYIEWCGPGYNRYLLKDLHNGKFAIQETLDLHGYTLEEAKVEINIFMRNAIRKSLSCVKIIHGRGLRSVKGPVIKKALCDLLSMHYRKKIIAYSSARQCDGGLGALYVLIKRV